MNYELVTVDGVKKIKRTEEITPFASIEEVEKKIKELEETVKGWNLVIAQNENSKKLCEEELKKLNLLIKKM